MNVPALLRSNRLHVAAWAVALVVAVFSALSLPPGSPPRLWTTAVGGLIAGGLLTTAVVAIAAWRRGKNP